MATILTLNPSRPEDNTTFVLKQRAKVRPGTLFDAIVSLSQLRLWFARNLVAYSMDNKVRKHDDFLRMGDYVEWSGSYGHISLHPDYKNHNAGSLRVVEVKDGLEVSFHTHAGESFEFEVLARGEHAEIHCTVNFMDPSLAHQRSEHITTVRKMLNSLCRTAEVNQEKHALRVVSST